MAIAYTPTSPDRAHRLQAWTVAALRDLVYDGAVFAWSIVAFTVLVTGVSVTASLLVLVCGIFVWLAFAHLVRGTTWVDRQLAGWQRGEPVDACYRRPTRPGFLARLRTVTTDPQTWRDLGWMALTSVLGFGLGLLALTGTAIVVGYLTLPLWYWAIHDPQHLYGFTNLGFVVVDSGPEALGVAAIGAALAPIALLVARACARTHAAAAARVLGQPFGTT